MDDRNETMLDRRTFLASSSVAAILLAAPAHAAATGTAERDAALDRMLRGWFDEDLREQSWLATTLGLDVGDLAFLRGRLWDSSLEYLARYRARSAARHSALARFGSEELTEAGRVNLAVADFTLGLETQRGEFPYGSTNPYAISQIEGDYYDVPSFLDTEHPIGSSEDVEHYLSRLRALARNLDDETEQIRHDASLGVIPPDFVIDRTLAGLRRLRSQPAPQSNLVRSLARRAAERQISGDQGSRAAAIVAGEIGPALDRQIAELERHRPNAVHDAGVWRLPDGEAFYALRLKANNTTDFSAEEIHRMGLAQVAELESELDRLLRAQGHSTGPVGQRINALFQEERFLFPNDDAGRQQLLAWLNELVEQMRLLAPRVFSRLPQGGVEIRRVPPEIEAGAPGGYARPGTVDGSRPGSYFINLRDTHEWPRPALPTLTYHEAIPGHVFQIALALEQGELPLYRRVQLFPAYAEGWGLYAERLADELGVYDAEPAWRIGYLQSYLFRAARLVVDTGIHHKRWSREQAIRYMVDTVARPEASAVTEVERYAVWPGQATAYKIGQTVISNLRGTAQRLLHERFDIKAFHDAVLLGGGLPLSVLEREVRRQLQI